MKNINKKSIFDKKNVYKYQSNLKRNQKILIKI